MPYRFRKHNKYKPLTPFSNRISVKSGNYKFTIKADGTCTKTKIETKTPDNSNSGKSDNTGKNNNGKTDDTIPAHTHHALHSSYLLTWYDLLPKATTDACVWKKKPKEGEPWVDLDGDGKWTAQVEGREYFKYFYYSDINGLTEHRNNYPSHGQSTVTNVHLGTTIIPAEYGYVPTTITPEWSEWDEHRRCMVCGEEMTEHAV